VEVYKIHILGGLVRYICNTSHQLLGDAHPFSFRKVSKVSYIVRLYLVFLVSDHFPVFFTTVVFFMVLSRKLWML